MWLDSHCHLSADAFDGDREAVVRRAAEAGVDTLIAIGSGYGIRGNADALALARREAGVYATAGVHPHEASELDDPGRASLREWLDDPRVVAVGECGLDYHYMNSPREAQRAVFAEQVSLARQVDLPLSIHVRGEEQGAFAELLDIWNAEGGGEVEGVLHCYTGGLDFALRAIEGGLYVSFSGIVTFKGAGALREVAGQLPLSRLLVETDAPFLAPQGHRGKRNEPAWVPSVGETLAKLHGVSREEIARTTRRNAQTLFRLPADEGAAGG